MAAEELPYFLDYFEEVARREGFWSEDLVKKILGNHGSPRGLKEVPEKWQRVFATAHDVPPEWHVRMQAAFQDWCDAAVSKTINMPREATVEDVKKAYLLAYDLHCKGITVYRDGSREDQVLNIGVAESEKPAEMRVEVPPEPAALRPRPRPDVITGRTQKILTGYGALYVTVNEDEKGLFEVFAQIGRGGGYTASFTEGIARLASLCLRSGVPVDEIIDQLEGIRSPRIAVDHGERVYSIPDAIAKAIKRHIGMQKTGVPPSERDAAWASAEVLVCTGFGSELPRDLASRSPRLRMIQTLLAGVDHLPFDRFPRAAIVCSNAGAYTTSVAEHAMALLLAAAKDVVARTEEIRRGIFDQNVVNKALAGSTVLILGLGGIGREVARLSKAFRMHTIGTARTPPDDAPADEIATPDAVRGLLPRADFVVLALPLTRETRGLVDAAFLQAMKPDAVLVNIARGKIVVEDDLFDHLRTHPSFRAALDVWWTYPESKRGRPFRRPFHELPNVLMTPHVANAIPTQRREAMESAIDNVLRFLRGETPRHVVDPEEYA